MHPDAARGRGNHCASGKDSALHRLFAFSVWKKRRVMGGEVESSNGGLIRNGAE